MDLELIYKKICERGKTRVLDKSFYTEKHHIIPRCLGGSNDKNNLTKLTAKEHFLCHKILCLIYPESEKLKYALWAMCNQKVFRDYVVSARDYEHAKNLCLAIWKRPKSSESRKKISDGKKGKKINRSQGGTLNHNYGKKWITNISTNESRMISGDIPEGWKLGRVKTGSLGKSNSIGKNWYFNEKTGEEKYFSENVPENWIKGRIKKIRHGGNNLSGKICYFNKSLNKEKYFANDDIIPDGWVRGKLNKRVWFHNTELNIEKLFVCDSVELGFIRGRLPKFPFDEEITNQNESIRIFRNDLHESSLLWHRDKEDRIIEPLEETDWLFQLDDELPKKIEGKIFIPKEIFHRIIKGRGDLKIKLIKL